METFLCMFVILCHAFSGALCQGLWFAYQYPFSQFLSSGQSYSYNPYSAPAPSMFNTISPYPSYPIGAGVTIAPAPTQPNPATTRPPPTVPPIVVPPATVPPVTVLPLTVPPPAPAPPGTTTTPSPMLPRCGVPNEDPNFFINQQRSQNTLEMEIRKIFFARNRFRMQTVPRIVGGRDVPNGSGTECWQVMVVVEVGGEGVTVCGGTIVGSRTVITAAHCKVNKESEANSLGTTVAGVRYAVYVGVSSRAESGVTPAVPPLFSAVLPNCFRRYAVAQYINHPNYATDEFDIAVLQLAEPIDFNAQGACACEACLKRQSPVPGTKCMTSGWGGTLAHQPDCTSLYCRKTGPSPVNKTFC